MTVYKSPVGGGIHHDLQRIEEKKIRVPLTIEMGKKQGRGRTEKEKEQGFERQLISQLGRCVTSGWTVPSGPRNDKLSADSDGRPMMQVPAVRLHDMSFPYPFGERWYRL
jgi:hypothetical protein